MNGFKSRLFIDLSAPPTVLYTSNLEAQASAPRGARLLTQAELMVVMTTMGAWRRLWWSLVMWWALLRTHWYTRIWRVGTGTCDVSVPVMMSDGVHVLGGFIYRWRQGTLVQSAQRKGKDINTIMAFAVYGYPRLDADGPPEASATRDQVWLDMRADWI
jgi:hypothetical protein